MNRLSISWQQSHDSSMPHLTLLEAILKVDGVPLTDFVHYGLATDLRQLMQSASESGEFFLINCGCGYPGCAGIKEGIEVRHEGGRIHWIYRNPPPNPATQPELLQKTPSGRPEWIVRGIRLPTRTFFFDDAQYRHAIRQAQQSGRYLLQQLGPDGAIAPEWNQSFVTPPPHR